MKEYVAQLMMTIAHALMKWAMCIRPSCDCLAVQYNHYPDDYDQCKLRKGHYGKCYFGTRGTIQFTVAEEAQEQASQFFKRHAHVDVYKGAIGGSPQISFIDTSIGRVASIYCSICDVREDISGDL